MRDFLAIILKVIHASNHEAHSNCNPTGLPTLHGSDGRLSLMNVFDKILFITKIVFIRVWWCLTYSLLSLHHSAYAAGLDPLNKVREVMRVIFPSITSRQLTNALVPCLIHNNVVPTSGTTQLKFFCKGVLQPIISFKRFARCPGLLLLWSS